MPTDRTNIATLSGFKADIFTHSYNYFTPLGFANKPERLAGL